MACWTASIEAQVGAERSVLAELRASSDGLLVDLGGDPSARDWTSFLPLRRDREEDWSDWLAQLIQDSRTGVFAGALLGNMETRGVDAYVAPTVYREVPFEGCRADLVIDWCDQTYTHIEVKVGDPNLGKTYDTAQTIELCFGRDRRRRADVVLLLPSQSEAWASECRLRPELLDRVHDLTWIQVARSLRGALPAYVGESIHWRVWAHAFCGAIEQDLLELRSHRDPKAWAQSLGFPTLDIAARLLTVSGRSLMLEKADQIKFLRDGLLRYPDAHDTVDYFEKLVMESILGAFDGKTVWKELRPTRGADGKIQATKGIGNRFLSYFVSVTRPHRNADKDRIWMALGLYWNPKRRPSAQVVAACTSWVDKGGPVPLLDLPDRDPRVVIGEVDKRGERRLLIEPAEDFDPAEAFPLLLDSMDAAMVLQPRSATSTFSQ